MFDSCAICGTTENLERCNFCGHSFCPTCKRRYPKRVEMMMREKAGDLVGSFLNFLGVK